MARPGPMLTVTGLHASYADGRDDPARVVTRLIPMIEGHNPGLAIFTHIMAEDARADARASAARWAEGNALGALDGIPIVVKDNIDVAGHPCTAGTAAFRARIPAADADVVRRLREAGAIILGKVNMHEAALGATTDNPVFGRCENPIRPGYTPGGSSGGSAAALAAGFCALALGTDTLGSARVPASYCGTFGFKPSHGAIDMSGTIPLGASLDCVGLLANQAEDIRLAFEHLVPSASRRPSQKLRLGRPVQLSQVHLSAAVSHAFDDACRALEMVGTKIVDFDLSAWAPHQARLAGLIIAEHEGFAFYRAQLGPELPGLSPSISSLLTYPSRAGPEAIAAALDQKESLTAAVIAALSDVDALILPTTPQASFPHGSLVPVNQADLTALASMAGAPAMSIPLVTEDLPVGLQIVGMPGADGMLIDIARRVDEALRAGLS